MDRNDTDLRYRILDPTGNITALVETPVEPERQPETAAALMRRHPRVEQVGFVRLDRCDDGGPYRAQLRMAGGEFCGNAAMSAAALLLLNEGVSAAEPVAVFLQVSGAAQPVEVRLTREGEDCFRAGVHMPRARELTTCSLSWGGVSGEVPLVRMEGISHLIILPGSVFFPLREEPAAAEAAVQSWCEALGEDGLGLMFLEGEAPRYSLTPLVYVPGSGTVFWERSCASGSSAVGMYLAAQTGSAARLTLEEPGGCLRVESDENGETWLYGQTRLLQ